MARFAALLLCPLMMGSGPVIPAGPAVNHSDIAFTLREKDLLPGSLGYDPRSGRFFVGSTRKGKVLGVHPSCREWDFVAARAQGLWMVIGMKADAARRVLWVASSDGGNLIGHRRSDDNAAGLFKFDLDSGKLLARYLLQEPGVAHFLDDLVVAPDGDVYVTHMLEAGQVWRLDVHTGTFAPFYSGDAAFRDPRGIALTPDGRRLYVADASGISTIDVAERSRKPLRAPGDWALNGIDGLYLYGRSLVFIQPAMKRVARCHLDDSGLHLDRCETLEQSHPMFDHPSTGVIVGDALYYVANSQFESIDSDGRLPPLERLYQPVILKLEL